MTTQQCQQFHRDGYVILHTNLPTPLHGKIQQRLAGILKDEGNPGNNILPAIPELQAILDAPELVTAVLTLSMAVALSVESRSPKILRRAVRRLMRPCSSSLSGQNRSISSSRD
ncbi:hypothetical protein [Armatimonas sp.]|uniref:hypothetical protein n=1 Tax=Armatimonas sp. TaxID=1872638 RepID=UPI0037515A5A